MVRHILISFPVSIYNYIISFYNILHCLDLHQHFLEIQQIDYKLSIPTTSTNLIAYCSQWVFCCLVQLNVGQLIGLVQLLPDSQMHITSLSIAHLHLVW